MVRSCQAPLWRACQIGEIRYQIALLFIFSEIVRRPWSEVPELDQRTMEGYPKGERRQLWYTQNADIFTLIELRSTILSRYPSAGWGVCQKLLITFTTEIFLAFRCTDFDEWYERRSTKKCTGQNDVRLTIGRRSNVEANSSGHWRICLPVHQTI